MKLWHLVHNVYREEVAVDGGEGDGGAAPAAVDDAPPVADAPAAAPAAIDPPADWPADWRAKVSADPKHSKTLDRFSSPKALFESYTSLRQKLDSGELKAVSEFPKDGTPEQQSEWRKSNGIPDSAEGYALKFGDGLVIGENDKQFVDSFLKSAHDSNASPEQVNSMLHWYYDQQERALDMQEQRDAEFLSQSDDSLRAEWGPEYRSNINVIKGLVGTLPESVRDLFVNARLGDGNALLNHPDIARWLVHTGKTINPVATVVPGAGANVTTAISDEIDKIEKVMREDRSTYNRDVKMQERLRDLYDARERAK